MGIFARERTKSALDRLVTRFGTGTVKRSLPLAIVLMFLAAAVGSIPFWLS